MRSAHEVDTYTWLLTAQDACPFCGAHVAPDAAGCAVCGRSLIGTTRPPERSQTVLALTGAWAIGAAGAVLALVGAVAQLADPAAANERQSTIALAVGSLLLGSFTAVMAWGCWERRPFAFYGGLALAGVLGLAGIGGGLALRGMAGLILVIVGVLAASALTLLHLSAQREFLGERQRQIATIVSTSARGLYQEGRECYDAGQTFLAAQCWARASSKDPANPAYLHALGLALARLGQHARALGILDRALQLAPADPRIRASYDMVKTHKA